jgi:hypothetical protein
MQLKQARHELFFTDFHCPTHDRAVYSLLLQVARNFDFDLVWNNGDFMDFTTISRFRTDPRTKFSINNELALGRKVLQEFRNACPNARMIYKEGNHSTRLQNFIWDHASQSDLEELELPYLLRLKDVGAEFIPNQTKFRVGDLFHLHGNEVACGSVYPARKMLDRINVNCIFGHYHRTTTARQRDLKGASRVAWSIGCTQSLDVLYDYHPAWDQAFATIEYTPSGLFHVNPVEVFEVNGKKACLVYGQMFSAK